MITEEQWNSYRRVQDSGATNMLDYRTVHKLSGLSRDTIKYIIQNYAELKIKFEGDNK